MMLGTSPNDGLTVMQRTERWLHAGALVTVVDGLWASAAALLYGRTVTRLWQSVASVAFGPAMFQLGTRSVLIGLAMHVATAFAWSAVLLLLLTQWSWLRDVLASPRGPLKVAAVFGPFVWIVMSGVVIPSMTGKPLAITGRWWVELAAHVVTVALPMAWTYSPRRTVGSPGPVTVQG